VRTVFLVDKTKIYHRAKRKLFYQFLNVDNYEQERRNNNSKTKKFANSVAISNSSAIRVKLDFVSSKIYKIGILHTFGWVDGHVCSISDLSTSSEICHMSYTRK
jgi:hypothetical protein